MRIERTSKLGAHDVRIETGHAPYQAARWVSAADPQKFCRFMDENAHRIVFQPMREHAGLAAHQRGA